MSDDDATDPGEADAERGRIGAVSAISSDAAFASLLRAVAGGASKRSSPAVLAARFRGQTLGPYRLEQEIGRGGFGVVFRAVDERLHRVVAVKLTPLPPLYDDQVRDLDARAPREARLAASVEHHAVVRVYDVGVAEDVVYIVTEFIRRPSGGTLRQRLRSPLSTAQCQRIACGIAEGLAAIHDAGIVHGDLKPDNVALDADGAPKILDFGLAGFVRRAARPGADGVDAQPAGEDDREGVLGGTAGYLAPEAQQEGTLAPTVDVFAFGVILRALCACLDDAAARAPLTALADRCSAIDPAERPLDGRALGAALAAVFSNPSEAPGPRPEPGVGRRRRASAPGRTALIAVVVVLAGVAAFHALRSRHAAVPLLATDGVPVFAEPADVTITGIDVSPSGRRVLTVDRRGAFVVDVDAATPPRRLGAVSDGICGVFLGDEQVVIATGSYDDPASDAGGDPDPGARLVLVDAGTGEAVAVPTHWPHRVVACPSRDPRGAVVGLVTARGLVVVGHRVTDRTDALALPAQFAAFPDRGPSPSGVPLSGLGADGRRTSLIRFPEAEPLRARHELVHVPSGRVLSHRAFDSPTEDLSFAFFDDGHGVLATTDGPRDQQRTTLWLTGRDDVTHPEPVALLNGEITSLHASESGSVLGLAISWPFDGALVDGVDAEAFAHLRPIQVSGDDERLVAALPDGGLLATVAVGARSRAARIDPDGSIELLVPPDAVDTSAAAVGVDGSVWLWRAHGQGASLQRRGVEHAIIDVEAPARRREFLCARGAPVCLLLVADDAGVHWRHVALTTPFAVSSTSVRVTRPADWALRAALAAHGRTLYFAEDGAVVVVDAAAGAPLGRLSLPVGCIAHAPLALGDDDVLVPAVCRDPAYRVFRFERGVRHTVFSSREVFVSRPLLRGDGRLAVSTFRLRTRPVWVLAAPPSSAPGPP